MVQNDLKFFTNEPERDLYSRFATILKSNTQFFDVLVGYFRSSGFFKLYESLETVEKIRILVGLNVDKFTVKIIDQSNNEKRAALSSIDGKVIINDEVKTEFEQADATADVEKGVRVFIDWLKSGKLEMRLYTEAPIHAKVYIMRKDPVKVPDMYGSVITGSSNFSEAGLLNNLEFNVELKDATDVRFALNRFEDLWEKSVDIKDTYIEAVEEKTWMKDDITPYQLYLKTIYEFFKEEINADKENFETLLPDGYMRLQYQIDAVTQARKKLDAYNGVFISDVVGLGKTYICAMLANSFKRDTYKLIICPPVLVDYWKSVLQEFDVARCDVESLGKLDRIIEKGTDKYSYVFIDEAHRFRNSDTESFTKLHQICRDKKVILISATPINNYTSDIENQIYLFQSKQSGTINGIKNIEGFFRGLNSALNKTKKGTPEHRAILRKNSEIIRDRLIREVMIRRTRGEVKQYYKDDLEKQGLHFPTAGSPEKIAYEFDQATDEAFTETITAIKDFGYTRYTPLLYLKDKKKYANADDFDSTKHYKVINTGTIGRFVSRWGKKPMKYLKANYDYPVVDIKTFHELFPNSYGTKPKKEKVIIKGLTLLDGCIDFDGVIVPGKSTMMISCSDDDDIKYLASLLNSKLMIFYIKQKYSSSSYNGGITFTKDMIHDLPWIEDNDYRLRLIELVNKLVGLYSDEENNTNEIAEFENEINGIVFKMYGITEQETDFVNQSLSKK